jgi:chromosome segregation ATPase
MTDEAHDQVIEAQDQVIGRLVRERRSAQMRLDTLRREGKNLGAKFKELSENMDSNIQRIWLQKGSEDPPHDRMIKVKMSDVNGEALADLTNEIRATQVELDRLNEECRVLGY